VRVVLVSASVDRVVLVGASVDNVAEDVCIPYSCIAYCPIRELNA